MDPAVSLEALSSKPLVGFSMDATHLFNTLQAVIRALNDVSATTTQLSRRCDAMEDSLASDLQSFSQRLGGLEQDMRAVTNSSVGDDLQTMRTNILDMARVVDDHSAIVPDLERRTHELSVSVNESARALDSLRGPTESAIQDVRRGIDAQNSHVKAALDATRSLEQRVAVLQNEHEQRGRSRGAQEQRLEELCRDAVVRTEKVETDLRVTADNIHRQMQRLQEDLADQLSNDIQVTKLQTEIANLRAELNTVDNDGRHSLSRVKEDTDQKFMEILQALQAFERNNALMEKHIESAGKALASRHSTGITVPLTEMLSNSSARNTPHRGETAEMRTTTTTTSIGGRQQTTSGGTPGGGTYRGSSVTQDRYW